MKLQDNNIQLKDFSDEEKILFFPIVLDNFSLLQCLFK